MAKLNLPTLIWVVPLQDAAFWRFRLYRGIWRFPAWLTRAVFCWRF
jgi:hypothetical protein